MLTDTNLQNLPGDPEIKRLIVPRDGMFFIEADLSQAESRIVAWRANETALIEKYEKGEDVHSFVASLMFGKLVKKGMDERQTGKKIGHASNYGMGVRKLCDVLFKENEVEIPESEARRLQNRYYQSFSGIKGTFQREIRLELAQSNRVLINPFGRRRKFWQPWGDELFRQAYSHYAQSTVADVMNRAMINCHVNLKKFGIVVRAQIHDSLLLEIPKDWIGPDLFRRIVENIQSEMTIPFEVNGVKRVIPIEFKWASNNLGEMEEVKL